MALEADGLEHQVAGRRDDAAKHDCLRVEHRRQVGDRHADVLGGIANHGNTDAVALPRCLEHIVCGDAREITSGCIGDARVIARLDSPNQPPDDAGRGHLGFEAAETAIVFALDGIEREPSDRSGETVRAVPRLAVEQDAGGHVFANRAGDDIREASRRATPLFGEQRGGAGGNRDGRARLRAPRRPMPRRSPPARLRLTTPVRPPSRMATCRHRRLHAWLRRERRPAARLRPASRPRARAPGRCR